MVIGIINTALIAVVGVFALFRWRHLRWFPVYALLIAASATITLIFPGLYHSHEFYLITKLVGELLCLLAYIEVMRKEVGHEPWWAIFAVLGLVVIPFLPLPVILLFYLPPSIFNLGQALEMPNAIKKRSALILAWSISGSTYFVSDILKMTVSSRQIWDVLVFLDPFFFTAMCSVMLVGLLWPEVEKVWGALSRAVGGRRRLEGLPARGRIPAAAELEEPLHAGGVVMQFPLTATQLGSTNGPAGREDMEGVLEHINSSIDSLKDTLRRVAAASFRTRETFLSPGDLSLYLGVPEATARNFVERRKIDKVQLTENPDEWVIFRADVDEKLGGE